MSQRMSMREAYIDQISKKGSNEIFSPTKTEDDKVKIEVLDFIMELKESGQDLNQMIKVKNYKLADNSTYSGSMILN